MTRPQNRGAQARRDLGPHGQADAETAADRPGLQCGRGRSAYSRGCRQAI